jgi:hypothetical protein
MSPPSNSDTPHGRAPGFIVLALVLAWAWLMASLADAGVLASGLRVGPLAPLQVAMATPIVLFWLAYVVLAAFRRWMKALDPTVLVGLQLMRVLGAAHLSTWGYGLMAGGFALPVAIGNFIVALIAVWALRRTAYRLPGWRAAVIGLSVIGLAEFAMTFVLAVSGFLAVATPLDPEIAAGGYASPVLLPLSIYPSYLIPLFTLIHFVTLVRVTTADHKPA